MIDTGWNKCERSRSIVLVIDSTLARWRVRRRCRFRLNNMDGVFRANAAVLAYFEESYA